MYLVVRFWVFVFTYSRLERIRRVALYFYIVAVLDGICCLYESREMVLCKLVSLVLIFVMIVYLSIVLAWFVRQFEQSGESIIILDIARASIYLFYSLLEYFYYCTGLKELYEVER